MGSSSPPPTASAQPRGARPRRPWFLTLALTFASLVGGLGLLMSSMTLSLLHVTPDEFALTVDRTPELTPEERTRQKDAFEEYTTALHDAQRRVVPLSVAELLLGAAMIVFAQRAASGRSWARTTLIQLTLVHVALTFVEWKLTPELRGPEDHFELAYNNLDGSQVVEGASKLVKLGLGAMVSAVAVLGMTLPRSTMFYAMVEEAGGREV